MISTWEPTRGEMDGLIVRKYIPNKSSIDASLSNYRTVLEISAVPFSEFKDIKKPSDMFYAVNDIRKSEKLADEIAVSGEINPLIVVIDKDGPYILEGAHRFVALQILGFKRFPALVVLDDDNF